jgi:DNA-binding NtrC family response regulator
VLVVDDEPLVRWSLTTGLRLAGFDAVPAADVSETLAQAALPPRPAVVLLDVSLWNADPRQVLAEIRSIAPDCRFLILAVEGQAVALPPWDNVSVVRKPFDLDEVVRLVEDIIPCVARQDRRAS